jgi:hypothetical protein
MIFAVGYIYALILLGVGLAALIWPERIRRWFLSQQGRKWWFDPFKLDRYVWMSRVYRTVGALFVLVSFLLQAYALRVWWVTHR